MTTEKVSERTLDQMVHEYSEGEEYNFTSAQSRPAEIEPSPIKLSTSGTIFKKTGSMLEDCQSFAESSGPRPFLILTLTHDEILDRLRENAADEWQNEKEEWEKQNPLGSYAAYLEEERNRNPFIDAESRDD